MSGPVWELNCATIAANAATAAFAFDSGGWTVASIVPMPIGSQRLPRNCFRILGPNVKNRMISSSAASSTPWHRRRPFERRTAASPSNGDTSEPGPNSRSDHSPLTGTVAHRRWHHQDCENRVHVQNQARSSPENDFPVVSANTAGRPSPKATHMTRPVGSAISFGNTVRTICHDNPYLSLSPSRNTSHSSMGRSDCARRGTN